MRLRHTKWILSLVAGSVAVGYGGAAILARPTNTPVNAMQHTTAPKKPLVASNHASLDTPKQLEIPSLKISAPILPVGLTKTNDMDVPNSVSEVGWYKYGTLPGHTGNAVLAGHLGIKSEPAIFWNLDKLKIGEFITVRDAKKQTLNFRVVAKQYYVPAEAPREKIFGKTTTANLNLITCSGSFIENRDDYTKRLVVFTQAAQ
jgi:LPXTG-site transpeptidase (sortase) family protein